MTGIDHITIIMPIIKNSLGLVPTMMAITATTHVMYDTCKATWNGDGDYVYDRDDSNHYDSNYKYRNDMIV